MIRHPERAWKLALLTLVLAALPASALASSAQPASGQDRGPFGGTIDLQPGAINGQVTLDPASVSLQASLADPGIDGQLQVTIPGQFVGEATANNGQLAYNLAVCGPGVSVMLSGASATTAHFAFQDTASHPGACSSGTPATALDPLFMQPMLVAAQAEPTSEAQTLLANWVRRVVGLSVLAVLLVLLIPAMPRAVDVASETTPWSRLGIGLAVALMLPLIGILVFALGLPLGLWWLGIILLALYPVLLLLSMSVAGLATGSWLNRRVSRPGVPILVVFGVGMLAFALASLLPYVGPIVTIVAVIFGLGTLALAPRTRAPVAVAVEPDVSPAPVSGTPVAA